VTRATTTTDLVAGLRAAGVGAGTPVGVAWSADGVGLAHGDALLACPGDGVDAVRRVLEALRPRLVWWSARDATPLVRAGVRVASSWDLAATHCLLHGGSDRDPALVWAVARGLDPAHRPRTGQLDLLAGGPAPGSADDPVDPAEPVRPDGHLRPGWAEGWFNLGGALYQINSALPYAVAAVMYLLLFVSMHWIGKRVAVHGADA